MTVLEVAKKELKLAGLYDKDSDYNGMVGEAVEELFTLFCNQHHSGMSARFVADIFNRLARDLPLSPLSGKEDEWVHVAEQPDLYQNNRCSAVFTNDISSGKGFYIDGIVFYDKGSSNGFQTYDSRVDVEFPCYTPETIHIVEGTPEAEPYKHIWEKE